MHDRVCPPRRMRFSFESRCRLVARVLDGETPSEAAAACGASRATGYRLWSRYREGGWAALADRPPVPKRQPRRLPTELEQRILAAREYAQAGPVIVAGLLGLPASTVWKVLRRHGASRLRQPAREPVRRYERKRPGELVHVDIKKLGRFWTVGKRIHGDRLTRNRHAGWQFLHLAIDDHSRLAYAELLPSESPADCVAFLRRANSLVCRAGDHGRARPLRQRQRLPLLRLARPLRRTRDRPPLHPPPQTPDQRQSRSARQDTAPRMGLPLRLPQQRPPRPSTPRLHPLVQPTPTTQLDRRQTPDQPRLTPLWASQLAGPLQLPVALGVDLAAVEHPQPERDRDDADHEQRPDVRPREALALEDRAADPA